MYNILHKERKVEIAKNFYEYLNLQYSSIEEGTTMSKWIEAIQKADEEMNISKCLMNQCSYRSVFDLLYKRYMAFQVTDCSCTPHKYKILNEINII